MCRIQTRSGAAVIPAGPRQLQNYNMSGNRAWGRGHGWRDRSRINRTEEAKGSVRRRAGVGVGTGLGRGRLFPFGRGGTIAPANSPIASENVPEFCRGNTDAFALP